jgi:L-ribulose-5-phosphate 3-epimerase
MNMARREFLQSAAVVGTVAAMSAGKAARAATGPRKAVLVSMLPKELSYLERFRIAKEAGFEGLEGQTVADPKEAELIRAAAEQAGVRIHSVMNMDHWKYPLSSSKSEDVDKSVAGMETSIRNAKLWGADTVLLVPAVVNAQTPYRTAWQQSQKVIRERILPFAKEQKIVIGIEEVWNKFLLSPMEFETYVDNFKSPWVKAYFDVGNVVRFGYPQDWIRTLGKRIVKVHLKDFMEQGSQHFWKNIGEGAIDWPEVRRALAEVGYDGYVTTEIQGGDLAYLKDVSARLDRFLAGQPPVRKEA